MLTRSKVIIRLRIPHTNLAALPLSSASGVSCYLKLFLERGKWWGKIISYDCQCHREMKEGSLWDPIGIAVLVCDYLFKQWQGWKVELGKGGVGDSQRLTSLTLWSQVYSPVSTVGSVGLLSFSTAFCLWGLVVTMLDKLEIDLWIYHQNKSKRWS